ncbi:MAG TPA: STAS domain-containing protein [Anaerolineales bacterium]|jgi:hypothetical protein|nr:STAS domain-containing protein [Anaerolineales bacterium]HQX15624.1 STAS domain-containing protein [Anaerolineales bacterium]
MSELTISTSHVQGNASVTILDLAGHLHGATEHQLLDAVRQAYEDGARHLVLDTSGLDVLSSAGLRGIQGAFKLFTPPRDAETINRHEKEQYKSPYFKMICSNPQIYYILNITGFVQNIPVYNNMEEALQSFDG